MKGTHTDAANPAMQVASRTSRKLIRQACAAVLSLSVSFASVAETRTDVVTYHDNYSNWVLGQVATLTNSDTGIQESQTVYHPVTARAMEEYSYGKKVSSYTYNADGTFASVTNGLDGVTTFSSWKRGIPQTIGYPGTPEAPSGTSMSASVSDLGWIESVTDYYGKTTNYRYDAMGRVDRVTYPAQDTVAWAPKNIEFKILTASDVKPSGIIAGQWRRIEEEGGAVTVTYFDVFWRPVLTHSYDANLPTTSRRSKSFRYDFNGNVTFQSFPSSAEVPAVAGQWKDYDPLGRVISEAVDSELSPALLVTTTSYSSDSEGLYSTTTDPRGKQRTTWYQNFDRPELSRPIKIRSEEGVTNWIDRNLLGKPTALRQASSSGASQITRSYRYNTYQELCMLSEPETGTTYYGYDGAGNLSWSAAGYAVGGTGCNTSSGVAARRVDRTYDKRNRLRTLSFPDSRGNQTWSYTHDGQPLSVSTMESAYDTQPITNSYAYNFRRLLISESISNAGSSPWSVGYGYSANGHPATLVYPSGQVVNYAPNALGQPTQVGSYATGISYYPNGAIAQFAYGNGAVHAMTQNARQLPARSSSVRAGVKILDLAYSFDRVGSVVGITDHATGRQTRSMTYDGLNRLVSASSPMFGNATYTYDALDNIATLSVTGGTKARSHQYVYEAGRNRIASIKDVGTGATVVGYGFDDQGNVTNRNGVLFDYDFGNRLRSVSGKEVGYAYDAHGRRARAVSGYQNPRYRRFFYNVDGNLLYESETTGNTQTENIYLAGTVIASRKTSLTIPGSPAQITYLHTDALGTPVSESNSAGQLTVTHEYEPFGQLTNEAAKNRIGYSGHVEDAATGLTYMQQRYYDPATSAFLSVDPVTAYESGDRRYFNRYAYAFNNPYTFTDPDGRGAASLAVRTAFAADLAVPEPSDVAWPKWVGWGVAIGGALLIDYAMESSDSGDSGDSGGSSPSGSESSGGSESAPDAPAPGTKESTEGVVYVVPGTHTSSGLDYVGTTDDMPTRERDSSDGRDRTAAQVIGTYPKGDREARQNAEQKAMNDRGGRDKLDNRRNEVDPRKWKNRGIDPPSSAAE